MHRCNRAIPVNSLVSRHFRNHISHCSLNMSRYCPYTYLGAALFFSVPVLLNYKRKHTVAGSGASASDVNPEKLIVAMETIVQADEGRRGIKEILLPSGEMLTAARAMVDAKRVAIITGFPCMMKYTPPTETDGPLGALALAKCLLALGKDVVVATDECNEEVLLACAASTAQHRKDIPNIQRGNFSMESFPATTEFGEADERRLQQLAASVDLVIAIERAGPCKDGTYLTMRGYDMSHLVAPLELLLMPPGVMEEVEERERAAGGAKVEDGPTRRRSSGSERVPRSIGIGDGGNEVGMGKVYQRVIASSITNAAQIACVVPTDQLIVSSVSNWGGYALAAAAAVVDAVQRSGATPGASISRTVLLEHLAYCLPSKEEEMAKCQAIVAAGARDGVSGQLELSIDGMPLSDSLEVLRRLRELDLGNM